MRLWKDVLGVRVSSIDEDFFEIGGHSLLAARLVVGVRMTFGVTLPFRAVFDAPTVRGLASVIEGAKTRGQP